MRGIVICKAGVGTLESLVAPAEGSELGVMVEVSNSYSVFSTVRGPGGAPRGDCQEPRTGRDG